MIELNPKEKRKLAFSIFYPTLIVLVLWLIKLFEWKFKLDFSSFGILPRSAKGLMGILFSPLIHGSFNHLINNSLPLFFLSWMLFYFYRSLAFRIIVGSYLLAGLYTWISARASYHIGASGLVYALFGFLLLSGFIRKNIHLISISFLVAFLYGSLVWGILPWDKSMSWEGHFWGLLVGIVFAFYYRKSGPQAKKYQWEIEEEDEDDDFFEVNFGGDENQNFSHTGDEGSEIEYKFKP